MELSEQRHLFIKSLAEQPKHMFIKSLSEQRNLFMKSLAEQPKHIQSKISSRSPTVLAERKGSSKIRASASVCGTGS